MCYRLPVRKFLITLMCIMFSMHGSLVTATHTMAHAQSTVEILDEFDHESAHEHLAHEGSSDHHGSSEHHKPSGEKGDHGAELHFAALDATHSTLVSAYRPAALRTFYSDKQQPAPMLPPDPDPDRA